MDEFFGGKDGTLRMISITDSTMMRIVHTAMNKAHERVKFKEGVIERLNQISKFYESAVMQLEGCMEFLQDENSHEEEVLAGLLEIRNRLKCRLSESENAIAEKDRELVERAESETRLRQALEMKEIELASLKAKLEKTRSTNEGIDGSHAEEFCDLKNSVDQQVWNIRQKLEPEHDGRFSEDYGIGDEKVEQMGFDIDALKETLDVAFRKMRSAIFLSEGAPVEQQWRWGVEKDTFFVLIRGLVCDFREKIEGRDRKVPYGFDEFWRGLVDEVEALKNELSSLFGHHEEVITVRSGGSLLAKEILEESDNEGNTNLVTKLIKNHESIIRKKSAEAEELSALRREVTREKAHSLGKRENEPVSLKRRVQELIVKLEILLECKEKFCELRGGYRVVTNGEEIAFDNLAEAWESMNKVSSSVDEQKLEESNLETRIKELNRELCKCDLESLVWVTIFKYVLVEMKNKCAENIENFKVEAEMREEICWLVFDEVFSDFRTSLNSKIMQSYKMLENIEIEETVSGDIQRLVFREIFKDLSMSMEVFNTDCNVREEMFRIVFDETIKTIVDATSFASRSKCEEVDIHFSSEKDSSIIKLDVTEMKQLCKSASFITQIPGFFQEMVDFENLVREKLEFNSLRLEEIKHGLNPLVEIVSTLRKKEELYRRAFIRRCQNLDKAETEVDLLGDQVEVLVCLLKKIHTSLQHSLPVLSPNVLFSEILMMINKELDDPKHRYTNITFV